MKINHPLSVRQGSVEILTGWGDEALPNKCPSQEVIESALLQRIIVARRPSSTASLSVVSTSMESEVTRPMVQSASCAHHFRVRLIISVVILSLDGFAVRSVNAQGQTPPLCRHQHQEAEQNRPVPTPGNFGSIFMNLGQQMASDPANGMKGFVDWMSGLDEAALKNVRLSLSEERKIGRQSGLEMLKEAKRRGHDEVTEGEELQYLKDLVQTIAPLMEHRDRYQDIRVVLIEAPEPDGYCLPGGFLIFTTGLLDQPDEATVVGVVAHELAHLDLGHVYQYAKRSKLAETTFGNSGNPETFMLGGMAMMGLMMNPYRPEDELEADCRAATWMYQTGYDPMALVRFFERLHERIQDRPAEQDPPFFFHARSHPYSLRRGQIVQDRLQQLQAWRRRDDLGLFPDNLRARTSRIRVQNQD